MYYFCKEFVRQPISILALFGGVLYFSACYDSAGFAPSAQIYIPPATATQPALPANIAALVEDYDGWFTRTMAQSQTTGAAVVIVKGGEIVFQKGYGVKSAGGRDSVGINTVFRVGSLSKGFAGILSGILVQDSLFQWDHRVKAWYPEFTLKAKDQAKRIQIRHLLSHTTGLPYHAFTNLIEDGKSIPEIVEYFSKTGVYGEEGKYYSYQNAAFCVIEEVMRKAAGSSYQELLQNKIFTPSGMRSASCDFQSMNGCTDKALPHMMRGGQWTPETVSPAYYNAAAAGGVNASVADMGEWLKLLLGYKPEVIRRKMLDEVFEPVVQTDKERHIFPGWIDRNNAWYALGWRVLYDGADTIVYHGGYVNGYRGEIALNRKDDIAVCVLFNAFTEMTRDCVPAFFERWKKLR